MSAIEPKEICEITSVDEHSDFKNYLGSSPLGFKIIPMEYFNCDGRVLCSETGDFAKWVRKNNPAINVEIETPDKKLILRSGDYWLPLVFLANDVTLPIYLNIVASYLYEKMKGALKGEKARVHLSAIYENKSEGIAKKFDFEGDIDSLQKVITKFNLNKFLDE